LATTERSSPLYLYRFSVSTPCAPINPILLGRARRRPGALGGGGDRGGREALEGWTRRGRDCGGAGEWWGGGGGSASGEKARSGAWKDPDSVTLLKQATT
jgi:hypothetical protein